MTDPPPKYLSRSATSSSAGSEDRLFTAPAISITDPEGGGHQHEVEEATNLSSHTYDARAAYGANPQTLDREQASHSHASQYYPPAGHQLVIADTSHPLSDTSLARISAGAGREVGQTSPLLGPFGSQESPVELNPYIDFAPQPIYEPTGELLQEQIANFQDFDSPVSIKSSEVARNLSSTSPNVPEISAATISDSVFVQPPLPKSALKRKREQESGSSEQGGDRQHRGFEHPSPPGRSVSFERMSRPSPPSAREGSAGSEGALGQRSGSSTAPGGSRGRNRPSGSTPRGISAATASSQYSSRPSRGTRSGSNPQAPSVLPPEKVFPIQIGSELFRLSGASISSDAPSYFTQFFEEQIRVNEESGGVRTLYIDRDPSTFRDVARHLQGYYIKPIDGSHFVKLFADAQFYSLPRLIDQLFESEIYIQIGERHFQIPKDIFSDPGNSPNFFSLGFAVFFSTPGEVFPGLDRRGLLRPPSIVPPYVPGRSSEIFEQLLHLLRGYPLHIRNESHRAELLRDCRYFHLRGLEQKLIAHEISYNLPRQKKEITLRLEDVKPSGVSFVGDEEPPDGWINYARPFVDDEAYEMIVEIGGECTVLELDEMRADFHGLAKARVSSLFQVVANKMNLPTNAPLGLMMLAGGRASPASPGHTPLSEDRVKIRIEPATEIILDGQLYEVDWNSKQGQIMLSGLDPEDDSSDAMSEASSTQDAPAPQPPITMKASTRQSAATAPAQPGSSSSKQQQKSRSTTLNVPHPIQTSKLPTTPSTKKRKRRKSNVDNEGRKREGGGAATTAYLSGARGKANDDDDNNGGSEEWIIRTGQWRLRVQSNPRDAIRGALEIVFVAVKIDAYSGEKARNARRVFLNAG